MHRSVLLLLLIVTKATALNSDFNAWDISPRSVPASRNVVLEMNRCVLQCEKKVGKINAVVAENGSCFCDHFHHEVGNIYLFRRGKTLPERSLIFIPFTSAGNGFKSIGTEDVTVNHVGTPMVFTEDAPQGHLLDRKAMKLLTTASNYLSYSIPNSLIEKANSNGIIVTFWVKFKNLGRMAVIDFRHSYAHGGIFFHLFENEITRVSFSTSEGRKFVEYPADTEWHHMALIANQNSKRMTIKDNGVRKFDKTYSANFPNLFSNELKIGHMITHRADAALFCLIFQELGTKSESEIEKAITESKWACDVY